MNKILSIVTVNYNSGRNYKKTVESLLPFLAFEEVEFIVIDGGSHDASFGDIKDTSKKIDHLVVERDGGIYDAMNKGIKISTGRWLWFVNCGDIVSCNSEQLLQFLSLEVEGNLIYSDVCTAGGEIKMKFSLGFFMRSALNHQNMIYRRELLADGFNLKYRICSDYQHTLSHYNEIVPLKYRECLCTYSLDGVSSEVSKARRVQVWRERCEAQMTLPKNYMVKYVMVSFSLIVYLIKCIAPELGSLTAKKLKDRGV
ncbi:glycosyltransferase [Saccharophagus degradans]|uniref:B-glycosyltransferase-like protein n=1 Tax=Saccharophagus degradans (strain 2-40 / ATCC 43961 / DSM 17024) TaxID=203122 RepID=Q21IV1_SACD2|nr:glycosyltransferase [Saccharophagus degradans]ABD81378.1 b-glycosyltransferase-like protein [Saccharophagus degradans 2-40]